MHSRQIRHKSRYFLPPNRLIVAAIRYRNTPARSSTENAPPTSNMNTMMTIAVSACASPSISTGAVNHRHTGSLSASGVST